MKVGITVPRKPGLRESCFQVRLDSMNVFGGIGHPVKGFANDIVFGDGDSEQFGGHFSDGFVAIGLGARGGHGGRCANAHHVFSLKTFPQSTNQHGNVCALAAPIGVQFVQNQEFEALAMIDHAPVDFLVTREDQLQHHEVGQQYVRRIVLDALALSRAFLPGVAGHGKWMLAGCVIVQELVEFFKLTVGERVHRVNNDGTRARLGVLLFGFEYAIDDGYEKRQRLTGTGARGHHIAFVLLSLCQSFHLVRIQKQIDWRSFWLLRFEKFCASRMQNTFGHQLLNCA